MLQPISHMTGHELCNTLKCAYSLTNIGVRPCVKHPILNENHCLESLKALIFVMSPNMIILNLFFFFLFGITCISAVNFYFFHQPKNKKKNSFLPGKIPENFRLLAGVTL